MIAVFSGTAATAATVLAKRHTEEVPTRGSKSAWAIRDGKFLTIKHAALDLGWPYQVAINRFLAAEAEGLIRIEKDAKKIPGRIGLCANVPNAGRTKGKLNKLVQNGFPLELVESIGKLSTVDRDTFEKAYALFREWKEDSLNDAVAQTRRQHAQVEDTILQTFCLHRAGLSRFQRSTSAASFSCRRSIL